MTPNYMAFYSSSLHIRQNWGILALALFALASLDLQAQYAQPVAGELIHLRNPSFEDIGGASDPPIGWSNCGFAGETPVDVHPDPRRLFQVFGRAQQGNTYLGMVVRDNETWEAVGQELSSPMIGGQCYDFRIYLARSLQYISQSRMTGREENYNKPAVMRVFGGYSNCDKAEVIGKSSAVSNSDWQEYKLKLEPSEDYTHIIIEVFYKTPVLQAYNGNLLLDNSSPLVPIPCEEPLADNRPDTDEPPADPPIADVPQERNPNNPTRRDPEPAIPEPDIVRLGETEAVLEEGTVFRIENITFEANSDVLQPISEESLEEIRGFLYANPQAVVEIGGHASSRASTEFAEEISLKRSQAIVRYLYEHGVETARLFPKGYGKRYRVCNEDTAACQRKNQRVEVKIIRLQ
ncbi:MAG: OmpA family protein [Bacteroidota bacterium]